MKALITNNGILSRVANLTLSKNLNSNRAHWKDVPVPTISDNEILVKVRAVALNPTDVKHIDAISPPGSIVGCDFVGEVFKVGNNTARSWKIGDRVAGAVHGGLFPDRGSFAEYLKTDSDLVWQVPDTVDDSAATVYGVSAVTAMLALNVRLGLPWLDKPGQQQPATSPVIFVYAGSTSAGLFTIQLANSIGCTVVTTASPHSFDLVKSYGADTVYDYHESGVGKRIFKENPNIKMAVDCFSEGISSGVCDDVIGTNSGKVITLLPTAKPKTKGIEHDMILAYTLFGKAFQWLPPVGPKFPAMPADREALVRFYKSLPSLVETLKPLPTTIEAGGFDGILPGLEKLRAGKVSGSKLVVQFL
ncbi:GroES-like protein [Ophiobolus disseminans]|uniref:GroES-like protein n=1 Tax=Ophiobolus disseminans TaxID=1469910 RepID=A0A6A6ZYF0_9PLEO|nr:GroES-like protein [Ophiobolus disseminans]